MSVVKTIKRGELARHAYVPPEGTTGQVLAKTSDADADVEWTPAISVISQSEAVALINSEAWSGYFASGSESAPSISFKDDTDTGFYHVATNDFAAVAGGGQIARFQAAGMFLQASDGIETAPSYNFLSDSNTGLYRVGDNDIGIATDGTLRLRITTTSVFVSGLPLGLSDGITAPTAIVGVALIYVDAADGDLKVRFGDGTTKTLATDT